MALPQAREDRDLFFWLALRLAPGVGPARFAQLLKRFKTPEAVFRARAEELAAIPRLPEKTVTALTRFDWGRKVQCELEQIRNLGYRLITLEDRLYPPRLGRIAHPPPVLWVAGELEPEDEAAVAIVGSRSATEYGLATASRLGGELAGSGVCVVSGVALGIDAAAHRGALNAGGRTIGVLGSGLDVVYPRPNKDLYMKIPESGALVSEFPLGTRPEPGNFPARNRIIAGLSLAVVVVEAARRSGALITARLALEENREVFAVPGKAGSVNSRGTHSLLRQGALLAETGREIIEDILPQLGRRRREAGPEPGLPVKLAGDEQKIYEALGQDPVHVDVLGRKLGLTPSQLAPILLTMELKGLIKQLAGMRYTRLF